MSDNVARPPPTRRAGTATIGAEASRPESGGGWSRAWGTCCGRTQHDSGVRSQEPHPRLRLKTACAQRPVGALAALAHKPPSQAKPSTARLGGEGRSSGKRQSHGSKLWKRQSHDPAFSLPLSRRAGGVARCQAEPLPRRPSARTRCLGFGSVGSEAAAGERLLSEERAAFAPPQNGTQGSPGRMTR